MHRLGERSILGSIAGAPYENKKALDFSPLTGVHGMIEVMRLEKANETAQSVEDQRQR